MSYFQFLVARIWLYFGYNLLQERYWSSEESVVMQLSDKLKDAYCTLSFDNSSAFTNKLFEEGFEAIRTAHANRK